MNNVSVNFKKADGKIRHVNATNNGPAGSRVRMTGNFKNYQELEIPYARLHDSAFYAANYGGEYAVDVHRVFPNFDADENDPASYLFKPTDSYLEDIVSVGTKIYYRLGASIEHGYKRGTYPPKDFLKWAKICEHIIRHYTEGWADGYNHDIEYWEIWNEFDCKNHDGSNPCWQGTNEEYYDFYCTVSAYLKSKFPHLKIGGPALCSFNEPVIKAFLNEVKSRGAALDFFSYHWYGCTVESFVNIIRNVNRVLDDCGFSNMETHINEWNYIRGWLGEEYTTTLVLRDLTAFSQITETYITHFTHLKQQKKSSVFRTAFIQNVTKTFTQWRQQTTPILPCSSHISTMMTAARTRLSKSKSTEQKRQTALKHRRIS